MQRVEQNSAKEKRFLVQAQPVPSTWSAAAQRRASNAPNILDVVALARAQAEPPAPVRARPTLADAAMGVRQAALLIQRCYRGHRIRSRRRLQQVEGERGEKEFREKAFHVYRTDYAKEEFGDAAQDLNADDYLWQREPGTGASEFAKREEEKNLFGYRSKRMQQPPHRGLISITRRSQQRRN